MQRIDRLLKKAKAFFTSKLSCFAVDGNFIEALGLDPGKYIVNYPNGGQGYDDLKALRDVVPLVWGNDEGLSTWQDG